MDQRTWSWSGKGMRIARWTILTVVFAAGVVWLTGFGCCIGGGGNLGPATLPAGSRAPSASADLMSGEWLGRWQSASSDMDGELRCTIEKTGDGVYKAQFKAQFARIFTHNSTVTLTIRERGPQWSFGGEEDLGLLDGGVYKYEGKANGQDFVCNYDSSMDKGTFTMKRVEPATQPR